MIWKRLLVPSVMARVSVSLIAMVGVVASKVMSPPCWRIALRSVLSEITKVPPVSIVRLPVVVLIVCAPMKVRSSSIPIAVSVEEVRVGMVLVSRSKVMLPLLVWPTPVKEISPLVELEMVGVLPEEGQGRK